MQGFWSRLINPLCTQCGLRDRLYQETLCRKCWTELEIRRITRYESVLRAKQ